MTLKHVARNYFALSLACAAGTVSGEASAKSESMPRSMEEMWQLIQQQQREIEVLKKKAEEAEARQSKWEESAPAEAGAEGTPATGKAVKGSPATVAKSETERKTDILAQEVEKLKTQLNIPDTREYKSMYGLGPAASQVYMVKRGLSIGGYGEGFYTNYVDDKGSRKDTVDLARVVLYAGYKFNDWIVLNNEIEFEHATTGEGDDEKGEVSVEFSTLDFFLDPKYNLRTGLMLVPMGFINEIHEPLFYHGNRRPDVERFIIPSTWREMGGGMFGEILPDLQYRMYAMNGLRASDDPDGGFQSSGIRDGRQGGSTAIAEDWAFTGRVDYSPQEVPGLLVGASTFLGNAGQGDRFAGKKADVFTQLYEGHVQWHYRGFEFRGLGAWGHIGDAGLVSAEKGETIGSANYGWYLEGAYDVMPHLWKESTQYLAPFFRFERYDTLAEVPDGFENDGLYDRTIFQGGLTYKPHPQVVVKADYRNISSKNGQVPDEFNLGFGFIY